MLLVWPLILIYRESSWVCIMREISIQIKINLVLVTPRKAPYTTMDHDYGNTHGLNIRVDIWTDIYMVPIEYINFYPNITLGNMAI